jgi:arylsulfatase A-like enzyme
MNKQNILYILTDQHRWDMIGAYGHPLVKTPNIDSLAKEGIKFEHAYTPSSICGPARTSLFTGLVPSSHGVAQNAETGHLQFHKADPIPTIPTLGDYLNDYQKIYLGKWHIAETKLPSDYGFIGHNFPGYGYPGSGVHKNLVFNQGPGPENRYKEWLDEKGFPIPEVTESFFGNNPNLQKQELRAKLSGTKEHTIPAFLYDEAKSYIQNRDRNTPFFLWMNFWGPHTPCTVPEPYYSMYDPADIAEEPSFKETFFNKPVHQEHISYMWGVHDLNWQEWSEIIARYFGYITLIDDYIGLLLQVLKDEGLEDSTTVVFTADHGDAMGAHRLIEKGEFMYDETYRIPMIIKSPLIENPGTSCDSFVYLHDLFPTAIELAAEDIPELDQAQSLIPLLKGDVNNREYVYGQFTGHFTDYNQRMIRTREFKYIFNAPEIGELYHIQEDPHEMINLIDHPEYQDIKADLRAMLLAEMHKLNDPLVEWLTRIGQYY